MLKQLVHHSRSVFLGQCPPSRREHVSHIWNFLGAPEVQKLRRMGKSQRQRRQPMLLKMLKDDEAFQHPVAQELSRYTGASILWDCAAPALQELFNSSIFQVDWTKGLEQAHVLHMCCTCVWVRWGIQAWWNCAPSPWRWRS